MLGRFVTKSSRLPPPEGIRETRAVRQTGPAPPKFTGNGTGTFPGGPDSATKSAPSAPKTAPLGLKRPVAYTETRVPTGLAAADAASKVASSARTNARAVRRRVTGGS